MNLHGEMNGTEVVEKVVEAAGKHDRERDLEDGDSPGVPAAGVRLQEDRNLGPSPSPSVDQTRCWKSYLG